MKRKALPERAGQRPRTTPTNPHTQLDQNPEDPVVRELAQRVFALPHVGPPVAPGHRPLRCTFLLRQAFLSTGPLPLDFWLVHGSSACH